ncbi:MAG: EAL domain-containing protein, partial [Dongia sp.]
LAEDTLTLQLIGAEAWRLVQRMHQARKLQVQSRVLESAVNGVVIADTRGCVEWANPAFERMTGYTLAEIVGRNLNFLKSGGHNAAFYVELWKTIASGKSFAAEFINRRKDGVDITMDQVIAPVLAEDGKIDKYIAVAEDITERKSAEHRLNFLSEHDELTGVLKRATMIAAINQEIAESDRSGHGFAIHYIGLDHFTVVNDRLGRSAGDAVLKRVAQVLSDCLRPSDSVARCGGDEFAVLQRMTDGPDDAAALGRRLLGALSAASDHPEAELRIAASIGISVFPGDQGTAEALLTNAELAMRRAKAEIRGSLRFFTSALHEAAVTKATLATALPAAMRERQIFLVYQPIVDLQTGTIVGCEALARWRHPTLGLLPPGQFIQIAEETGQIRDLGLYILDRAIGEFSAALPDGDDGVTLSVNLSFGQFAEEELVDVIRDELARTRFPATRLELELTESMLAQEPERAIEMTRAVSALGCKLAIDD